MLSGELLYGQVGRAEVAAQFSTKEGGTLVAGIAALYNKGPGVGLGSSSRALLQSIGDFARTLGLSKVEVQAIAVGNKKLEERLIKQGFTRTTVKVYGQDVAAYTKTFEVK